MINIEQGLPPSKQQLHPDFGVEVTPADGLTHALIPWIKESLALSAVVLIRDTPLTTRMQLALASSMGAILGQTGAVSSRRPAVRIERGASSFTEHWHADQSWSDQPDVVSFLACCSADQNSDPTQFADTSVAYRRLDRALRLEIGQLEAFHHVEISRQIRHGVEGPTSRRGLLARVRQRLVGEARRALLPPDARIITPHATPPPGVRHPMVASSSASNVRSVRLGDHAWRTTASDPGRATDLIDIVNEHIVAADNVWTHHWRPGDIVLYDNSRVLHRRLLTGELNVGRVLRRVLVRLD